MPAQVVHRRHGRSEDGAQRRLAQRQPAQQDGGEEALDDGRLHLDEGGVAERERQPAEDGDDPCGNQRHHGHPPGDRKRQAERQRGGRHQRPSGEDQVAREVGDEEGGKRRVVHNRPQPPRFVSNLRLQPLDRVAMVIASLSIAGIRIVLSAVGHACVLFVVHSDQAGIRAGRLRRPGSVYMVGTAARSKVCAIAAVGKGAFGARRMGDGPGHFGLRGFSLARPIRL